VLVAGVDLVVHEVKFLVVHRPPATVCRWCDRRRPVRRYGGPRPSSLA
jgi:hypothetical protein